MGDDGVGDQRIAVLSDVHGNLTAFEAVLAEIARQGITTVLNLGDTVGKGPRGAACIALAQQRCTTTVRGNWDEWLGGEPLHLPRDAGDGLRSAVQWWHDELDGDDRRWLRGLPFAASRTLGGQGIRFVHASVHGVWTRVWVQHSAEEAAAFFGPSDLIAPGPTPTVACYGDLHNAYEEHTPDGLLVNVGSVGNSLDDPRASFAVLEAAPGGVDVRFERVEYDVEAELAAARSTGMPLYDVWARELREARYRGRTD